MAFLALLGGFAKWILSFNGRKDTPSSTVHQYLGTVYQGIDLKAWQRLQELLDKKDIELSQKEQEIKEWVRKYRELDQQLAAEGQKSDLTSQARELLHAGQLEEAGALLDRLLASGEAEVDRIASHHFSRAGSLPCNSTALPRSPTMPKRTNTARQTRPIHVPMPKRCKRSCQLVCK